MPWACVWHLKAVPLVRNLNGESDRKLNSRSLKIKKGSYMQLKSSEMKLGYGLLMVWSCIIWICFLQSLTVAPLASFSSSTTWRQARWPAFLKPTLLRLKYSRKGHVLFQEQLPKSYWFSLAPTRSRAHSWTNHWKHRASIGQIWARCWGRDWLWLHSSLVDKESANDDGTQWSITKRRGR